MIGEYDHFFLDSGVNTFFKRSIRRAKILIEFVFDFFYLIFHVARDYKDYFIFRYQLCR